MAKNDAKIFKFLLQHANLSIVYHVQNDILKDIAEDEKRNLQEKILQEKIIQSIIACQLCRKAPKGCPLPQR